MIAKIKLWGSEYVLKSINWRPSGKICHVCFTDKNDVFYTIFDYDDGLRKENAEGNKGNANEILSADLSKTIVWEAVKHVTTKKDRTPMRSVKKC